MDGGGGVDNPSEGTGVKRKDTGLLVIRMNHL